MSRERPRNIAVSVADRLLQRARQTGEEHQLLLTRFGLERLMYCLSESPARDRFVVQGALLFLVWAEEPFHATRDLDLLAVPELSPKELLELFRGLGDMAVAEDGLMFDSSSVEVSEIREDQPYGGLRVTMRVRLGKVVIPIQGDIGFGDAVTPEPKAGPFPVLLDFPPPILRMYPRETVVAEKFETMEQLGLLNSRMKDYYDFWIVARQYAFDGELLRTFLRPVLEAARENTDSVLAGLQAAPGSPSERVNLGFCTMTTTYQRNRQIVEMRVQGVTRQEIALVSLPWCRIQSGCAVAVTHPRPAPPRRAPPNA